MTPDTAMPTEKFDAYGEVLPDVSRGVRDAGSTTLSRVGQYAFWLLVVVIVSVRVLMYPATPAFDVGSAAASKPTIIR